MPHRSTAVPAQGAALRPAKHRRPLRRRFADRSSDQRGLPPYRVGGSV